MGRFTSAAVTTVAVLSILLLAAQPADAGHPSASVQTGTPVPQWVTPVIDHPEPMAGLLPPAVWWGGTGHGPVVTLAQATSIFGALWVLRAEEIGRAHV